MSSLQNQLRQELDYSNFQYLVRSVTDFQVSGSIRCSVITMLSPKSLELLDLRYMSKGCDASSLLSLSGAHIQAELKSLNGDRYAFKFISNNDTSYYIALWSMRIFGILSIILAFRNMKLRLEKEHMELEFQIQQSHVLSEISKKVAHDIRSPLSALNMAVNSFASLREEQKDIIKQASSRINAIANDLLANTKKKPQQEISKTINNSDPRDASFLLSGLKALIREKQFEYRSHPSLQLLLKASEVPEDQKIFFSEQRLQRILSNLVNNSIEAITDNAVIYIEVYLKKSFAIISVVDFGKGIPADVLGKIQSQDFVSYGKEDSVLAGSALGLESAYAEVSQAGGFFKIESKEGIGTKVTLEIPLIQK